MKINLKRILFFLAAVLLVGLCFFRFPKVPQETKAGPVADFVEKQFVLNNGAVLIENTDRNTVLSESIGLYLLANVEAGRKDLFDRTYEFADREMLSEHGVFYWKIDLRTGEKQRSSASLDDLRIVRALLGAWRVWKEEGYLQKAMKLADAIRAKEFNAGYMVDSFSWGGSEQRSVAVNISYLDLWTMKKLSDHDPEWGPVHERSRKLALDSMRGNGLFWESYDLTERKFRHTEGNMINQVMIALHLSEDGVPASEIRAYAFLEKLMGQGKIPNTYNAEGAPMSRNESAAVYALAVRLFRAHKNARYERMALDKMFSFEDANRSSEFYGGFGMFGPFEKKTFNSFDNLQALLVLLEH